MQLPRDALPLFQGSELLSFRTAARSRSQRLPGSRWPSRASCAAREIVAIAVIETDDPDQAVLHCQRHSHPGMGVSVRRAPTFYGPLEAVRNCGIAPDIRDDIGSRRLTTFMYPAVSLIGMRSCITCSRGIGPR